MESVNNHKSTVYINNLLPFMNIDYLVKILCSQIKEIKEIRVENENNPFGLPGKSLSYYLIWKTKKPSSKKYLLVKNRYCSACFR